MSQVICLGEILIDRIADEPGKDINLIQNWTNYPGGAPANVACALNRLGTSSAFLGCISQDQLGQDLRSTLLSYGVSLELLQVHPTASTRQVFVTRDANGDRTFAGFNQTPTTLADTKLSFQRTDRTAFKTANFLYLGSLILAESQCRQVVDQYLQLAKSLEIKIFMDVNLRAMFWENPEESKSLILENLKNVDYLKVSTEEAHWLFNSQDSKEIYTQYPNIKGLFITDGAKGCSYHLHKFSGSMPGFIVNTIDTTGAGDGFVAGCIHQLILHPSITNRTQAESLVRYANAVGALSTEQLGAIASEPTHTSVAKFLKANI